MKHINRLLIQARKAAHPPIYSAFCIIDWDERKSKWSAVPQLWDGVTGSGNMDDVIPADWTSEYDTADEAAEAVDRLFQSLDISDPNRVVIIIDDIAG